MTVSQSTNTSCTDRFQSDLRVCGGIIENTEVGPGVCRISLVAPVLAKSARPGQFVHVLVSPPEPTQFDPLLRRPLGIHRAEPDTGLVSILFEVRGRGTALLAQRCVGQTLDLLGPLGNGFKLPNECSVPQILVAGGMGAAPVYFLARALQELGMQKCMSIIVGARSADLHMCHQDFGAICVPDAGEERYYVATDDGSMGHAGFVTDVLSGHLDKLDKTRMPQVYACGPMPMLRRVVAITKEHGVKCQVSTEAKMACGVGACMGCVLRLRDGDGFKYVRACHEGPVFDADEIVWDG